MELRDSQIPFQPATALIEQHTMRKPDHIRLALLTERDETGKALHRALPPTRFTLTQMCSIETIEITIERELCDVAIVDLERRDEWPSSIFARFDDAAATFPIIILCKRREDIREYVRKAVHAIDIVSYDAVDDPRFMSLVEAAAFRAQLINDRRADEDPG